MNNKLIVSHNGGFFSCCTVRMIEIIRFCNNNKTFPVVDSSRQWDFYKDNPGDITEIFFKNTNIGDEYSETKEIDDGTSSYKYLDFKNLNILLKRYFTPSDKVMFNNIVTLSDETYTTETDGDLLYWDDLLYNKKIPFLSTRIRG